MMRQKIAVFIAALLVAAPAAADQIMEIKAGEWVRTMSMGAGSPGPELKTCAQTDRKLTDEVLNKMMSKMPGAKCNFSHSKAGNVVSVDSVCDVQGMHTNTVVTMTLVSEDEYLMSSKTHVDHGPSGMPPDMAMTMHWTRTGPCQPGDKMMPAQSP